MDRYNQIMAQNKFRFPSRGKVSPKKPMYVIAQLKDIMFRFPSRGKVSPKDHRKAKLSRFSEQVSIPFPRESVSKGSSRTAQASAI